MAANLLDDRRGPDNRRGESHVHPGFGLLGMRERAEAVGGRLEAGPRAGGGFQVRAQLPTAEPDQ